MSSNRLSTEGGCPPPLWLDTHAVGEIFTRELALQSQRTAFAALGAGTAVMPGKLVTPSPSGESMALTYTAQLSADSGPVTKFTAVHPRNPERGLPTITATVIALDADTGCVSAVLDGTTITTRRTAAATALAVSVLANEGPTTLTVFGYGVQAREHVLAVAAVRQLTSVHVAGRDAEKARALELELNTHLGIAPEPQLDAETAVRASTLVILCTTSHDPVIEAAWIRAGSLVVSVGSFEPDRHEVGTDTIARADVVVVDDPETASVHAGPIIAALETGTLERASLLGLGHCIVGSAVARISVQQIVFYNSTGLGIQDAAAAWAIIYVARIRGVGTAI